MFAGVPVMRMTRADREAEDLFIVQALENGYAKAGELAEALERPVRTVHRVHLRYVRGGVSGLALKKRGPKGPRLGELRETAIRRMRQGGASHREIARRLAVGKATVQRALQRMAVTRQPSPDARQGALWEREGGLDVPASPAEPIPLAPPEPIAAPESAAVALEMAAASEPIERATAEHQEASTGKTPRARGAGTLDLDPMDRSLDRVLAAFGQLADAAPLFGTAEQVPRAGVLLAVPLLVASGVFDVAERTFGSIGPAFYGLRTILLTLLFLGLLRIKHPENVKEYSPPELGRILGLDRAPEVKTIRRKLARMAQDDKTLERFVGKLVQRRVERASAALGFLYVDGHVRVYNGKHDLPKAHVARLRLSLPATQDVWVNDADGAPLFFLTQEAHPQLVSALRKVLGEVRKLVGKERRVTVVFDRGGWSPKLFQWMDESGFDVLTYRKNKVEPLAVDQFTTYDVELPQGKESYELADTEIEVAKGFKMRQVTRRKSDHQTHIVTTRRDLPVTEAAIRMFDRWRQENFFKYMRTEFAIDSLVEYGAEAADAKRLVPNPERKATDKELREAKAEVLRLEAAYGEAALDNAEAQRPTMRGFKIANGTTLGIPLRKARARVAELTEKRRAQPTKVVIGQIRDAVVRLKTRRKRLSDSLKMLAYQVETDIVRAVAPHYKRSLDEGRSLVRAALKSAADIEPTGNELRITLAPQSSPHRTRAIAQLCDILNAADTCFPGTELRLRYAIREPDCAT
jgi:hypothetical protein